MGGALDDARAEFAAAVLAGAPTRVGSCKDCAGEALRVVAHATPDRARTIALCGVCGAVEVRAVEARAYLGPLNAHRRSWHLG